MPRVTTAVCTRTEMWACDLNCIKFDEDGKPTICGELSVQVEIHGY